MKQFKISSEAVNTYGVRVLSSGMDIDAYMENPVVLWMHKRGYDDENSLPIAKTISIEKKKNGDILALPQFDPDDDFAMKIAKKVENGYLNAASVGIIILEWSDDPKLMLPGQTGPTVTKSRLYEWSVVDVPNNPEALRLYIYEDADHTKLKELTLSDLGALKPITIHNELQFPKMKKLQLALAAMLGLASDATEEVMLAAFNADQQKKNKLADELAKLELDLKTEKAKASFELALAKGKAKENQRTSYMKLALLDPDAANDILELGAPATETPTSGQALPPSATELLKLANRGGGNNAPAGNGPTEYELMLKQGTLLQLKKNNPDEFKKLEEEYIAAKGKR
jgi:hypothetical protein